MLNDYLKVLIGLLAIVNPLGAVPVFISLTEHHGPAARLRAAGIATASMCVILLTALVAGDHVLAFFGITIGSFRVGGGLLVLLIAISMLNAKPSHTRQTEDEAAEAAERDSVAVVPLSLPLLAGPGAISTIIVYANRASGLGGYLAVGAAVLTVGATVYAAMRAAPYISERLGRTGINVVTRLMGLVLAAIAVEFIAGGLKELFPGLAAGIAPAA